MKKLLLFIFIILFAVNVIAQTQPDVNGILYVSKSATGSGLGDSWTNAANEFADALKAAKDLNDVTPGKVKQIWVASGIYKPLYRLNDMSGANPTDRDNAFVLVKNVKVYGGFAGTETVLTDRNLALTVNKSILSGDFLDNDVVAGYDGTVTYSGNTENAHHVVVDYNMTVIATTTVLDGFTITGGNANISSGILFGGAFFIYRNSGAGLYCQNSSATFSNLVVTNSFSSEKGGGISTNGNTGSLKFYNLLVTKNTAKFGAGLSIEDANTAVCPLISNTVFAGNRATNTSFGGTIVAANALKLYNSILIGNVNGIRMEGSAQNPDIRNSIVQKLVYYVGGVGTEQSTNATTLTDVFTDALNGDYSLSVGSPAIDAGDATLYDLALSATDLLGNGRIKNGAIDMGPLESTPTTIIPDINGVVYVKKGGLGLKNGDSWINAAPELAPALKTAKSNLAIQQIWVAGGTYKPLYKAYDLTESLNNRDNAFVLVPNVKIYGGFAGTEASLVERNLSLTANTSILTGDFSENDNGPTTNLSGSHAENAYHVLISAGAVGTAEVNGFTIRGGNANNTSAAPIMVNGSPVIQQHGGGVYVVLSSPILKNNIIFGSYAQKFGGGLFNQAASPTITNCIINANTVGDRGGAMANFASSNPIITQVQMNNNIVASLGTHASAIYNSGSSPVITNVTMSRNTLNNSGNKGVISNVASSFPKIRNTIIFGNLYSNVNSSSNLGITDEGGSSSTVSYSLVQGLIDGSNHNINPTGLDMTDVFEGTPTAHSDRYTLKLGSPAINAGNNNYFDVGQSPDLSALTTDLVGNARIQKGTIDLGAYETVYSGIIPDANGIVYVKPNGAGDFSGNSWSNAAIELSQALFAAKANPVIKEIWLAAGTFKPLYKAGNGLVNQNKAFVLVKDVKIYGGFAGTETTLADRDLSMMANATVLSGDLNGDDGANFTNNSDNVHHVIIAAGDLGTALVDGVAITGGNANEIPSTSITVNGFVISPGNGGGIYSKSASLTFSNINIYANRVKYDGGAIYNDGDVNTWSALTVNNARINRNQAVSGAAAYNNSYSTLNLSNALISENTSNSDIISSDSDDITLNLTNTTIVANRIISTEDYLMYNSNADGGRFTLRNCLVLNNFKNVLGTPEPINGLGDENFTISNSLIEGHNSIANNNIDATGITVNDLFTSPTTGDYTLKVGSVAINKGNNNVFNAGNLPDLSQLTTDLAGHARVFNTTVDLGAFERQMKLPVISFNHLDNDKITVVYGDADFVPASSTSTGTITFSVPAGNGIASIVAGKVHLIATGETDLTVSQAGDAENDPVTVTKTILINKKALTASVAAVSKAYDGSDVASLSFNTFNTASGLVGTDDVSTAYTTAVYDNKNVGTGKTITITGLVLSGTAAGNYSLNPFTTTGAITAKALTASLSAAVSKGYDGSDEASLSFNAFDTASGLVGTDDVTAAYTTAVYDNKNVGTGKTITITGLALSGAAAGNYSLPPFTTTGSITAKALTASLNAAVSKAYDGSDAASLSFNAFDTASGLVGTDDVTAAYTTAVYDNKNVGTGKTITITGLALSGAAAGNYSLNPFTTTGSITAKALTASLNAAVSKAYDGNDAASLSFNTFNTASGLVGTDDVSATYTTALYDNKNVGTGKTITITGLALSGAAAGNYSLNPFTTTGSITAKALTASLNAAVSKAYDGSDVASLSFNAFDTASGLVGTDDVTATYTTALYDNKNVGTGKTITITGLALSGAAAGNYSLNPFTTTGSITAKALTASLNAAVSKAYDGSDVASLSFNAFDTASGLVGTDDVTATYTTALYDNKNVGTGKTITITGLALSGAAAGNYSLNPFTTTGSITAKALTASLNAAVSKAYDGNDAASLSFNTFNTASGLVGTDDVTATYTTALYDNKNVGTGKTITITGLALSGAAAGNYSLNPFTTTGAITAKALTASLSAAISKAYDGNDAASLSFNTFNTANGLVGTDDVTAAYTTAVYDNKNVGTGKTITITGLALSGAAAGNYSLNPFTTTGAITAKALTASLSAAVSKAYDGNDAASLSFNTFNTASGLVGTDDVSAAYTTALYDNKNVGTGKTITITGLALSGAAAGNYSLNPFTTTGSITAKALTASLNAAVSKAYDGNDAASLSFNAFDTASGLVGTDDVTATYTTALYDNKNVGTGKTITITGLALSGAAAGNYSLNPFTTTGSITAKALTASLNAAVSKAYDGNDAASLSFNTFNTASGLVGTDDVSAAYTTALYDNKNVGTGKTITITGLALSGAAAGNYSLNPFTTTGSITAKALTASLNAAVSKAYDGNDAASLSFNTFNTASGLVGTDDVSATYTTALYDNKNVGTGKTITITGLALSGAAAGNYSLNPFTTTGSITAKALTASLNAAVSKAYDGSDAASLSFNTFNTASGLVGTDDVSATYTTALYDNKNVGTGKTITITGLALSGAAAGNYSLNPFTTTGSITAKALTASLNAAVSKAYDGNDAASLSFNAFNTASGLVGTDDVTATYTTALYDNKNVGTGKTITITGLALSGAASGNYSLNPFTTTGSITAKALTASLNAAVSKAYDGSDVASLSFNAFDTASGLVGTDDVSATYTTALYVNKNVGTGKTITITGLALSGAAAGNYSLNPFTTTGSITAKALTASLNAAVSKAYDGNDAASLSFNTFNTASGLVGTDDVTATYTTALYDNKNVGTGKTITITGLALSGAAAGNYSLNPFTTTGAITAKALTASLSVAVSKAYNGNNAASLSFNAFNTASGLVGTDDVTAAYTTALYDNKNVGTGKTITITGLALSGAAAGNYSLNPFTTTGAITAKALTASLSVAVSKAYNGNNAASLSFNAFNTASGLVGTDDVSTNYATAVYDNKNVGTGKTITINGLALSGAAAGNYSLTPFTTTGVITAIPLIITPDNKEKFAGTANPTLTITYSGFVNNEKDDVLTTLPIVNTTAVLNSPIGDYPIIASGATATNYAISYVPGNLKIKGGVPTNIILTGATLYENSSTGTNAGTLSTTSDDPSATFTYTLVAGTGDADNLLFTINGNHINTASVLDFETKSNYSVRVRSTTQYGLSLEKIFTIALSDVNEMPTLAAINNQNICFTTVTQTIALTGISAGPETGQSTILSVSSSNTNLFDVLTVSSNGTSGTLTYRIKNDFTSGTVTVTVMVKDNGGTANGGVDTYSRTFTITVNALPLVSINSDKGTMLSKGDKAVLTATGGTNYVWSDNNSIIGGLNTASLMVRPKETTTYTVTATNSSGCQQVQRITLIVQEDFVIKANNILTPNNDGYNDKWVIDNIDFYPNNEVQVFDKAGRFIYGKKGYDNSWDGTLNGTPLAEGTYYYIIDFGTNRPKFKGYITLIREN